MSIMANVISFCYKVVGYGAVHSAITFHQEKTPFEYSSPLLY